MKSHRVLWQVALLVVAFCGAAWAQTGSITGTVKDPSGAAISGAAITVTSPERGITRNTTTNSNGDYNESALPEGTYDVIVTAPGFKKFQAKAVKLDVAQKARVDVGLEVGAATTEVVVEGSNVAQVETQSSELAGTVTGKEITQLELNGRNFTTLVSLVPGVSNQTGMDEPQVGINGSVAFSMNGGRTEYNNWELDGGDNMDNGSNGTLNVYPSVDAISEFKVLTSNYGAQYGRNGSGTVEVETKAGTRSFHGDAYEFVRNDYFNANNFFNSPYRTGTICNTPPCIPPPSKTPPYKKNDYGYTIGGPLFIPHVYNKDKQKTFFFWSQEWRRDRLPNTYSQPVPYSKERTGDFTDVCAPTVTADCPIDPTTGQPFTNFQVTVTPQAQALLPLIPKGTIDVPGASQFNESVTLPTNWREELLRVDHNITDHNRLTFRYIHDSWTTLEPGSIWDTTNFPTSQTFFNGPGVSMVARLTSTISPTLLNEFVASYTTDHISFQAQGYYKIPQGFTMGYLYPYTQSKLPAINIGAGNNVYTNGLNIDPEGIWPEGAYNSNPTYTYRDNLTKIIGRHNLTMGVYFVAAQKNELSSVQVNGQLNYSKDMPAGTGNPFADFLVGNISSFVQGSNQLKFYNRYKIVEPYFQDDWRVTDRLTLNLGLRLSLFGTYRDRYHHAYNWDPAVYQAGIANAPVLCPANSDPNICSPGAVTSGNPLLGLVQCGGSGGTYTFDGFSGVVVAGNSDAGCLKGHLFNPAPRVGFAYDVFGNGKTAVRGGYGVFYEHANGNEADTEGMESQSSPLLQSATQNNVVGYANIGVAGAGQAAPVFPLNFYSIPNKAIWPYMQQWHLDVQHEFAGHSVMTVSYVGSKGTHLGLARNLNQLFPVSASQNPYQPGQPITSADCSSLANVGLPNVSAVVNGNPVTGQAAIDLQTACGHDPNFYRPFLGVQNITRLENQANSTYHALQLSARKTMGALILSGAYTYSHSIDDSSDRYDGTVVNSYNPSLSRASSNFDQRHMLNISWVYDLPFFKKSGLTHTLLGGWEWSGIESFATGVPLTVANAANYADNAGVAAGSVTSAVSYPDRISDPNSNIPPATQGTNGTLNGPAYAKFGFNPGAFALPQGLTFGNAGRNDVRNPSRLNFDMGLFKHFEVKESMAVEFRAEAFNIFNHTQFALNSGGTSGGLNNSMTCAGPDNTGGSCSSTFAQIGTAHLARILQFSMKFIF